MADNVNDSLKNLNQNIKDADANLAKLSKDFNVTFTEAVNRAARDAKVSIDQMFDAIAGRVGASKASKLKLLFDIVDEHGKTATPQTIQQKIDRIVNATPTAKGTKLHIGMDWVDADKANANLRRYKEQLKLIQDMPSAYDLVMRSVNAINAGFAKEEAARKRIIAQNEKILNQLIKEEEKERAITREIERRKAKERNKLVSSNTSARLADEKRATQMIAAEYRARERYAAEREKYIRNLESSNHLARVRDEQKSTQMINAEYKRREKEAERHKRQIESTNRSLESMLPTLGRLASAFGVAFSVQGLVQFGKKLVETRGEFEMQFVAMKQIIGDVDAATKIWNQTMQQALQSPFRAMQLVDYTKKLAAYRIETDKLFDTTKRLADVSAGLGVDMGRLILAYGQVKTANFLRASEVRQFTEAGVNIYGELAKYFSEIEGRAVSTADVVERVSKRMVMFSDVEEIFKRMTDEGGTFFNMQEVQANTVRGQIMKLHDAYDQMLNTIGEKNNGKIKDIIETLNNLVRNWQDVAAVMKLNLAILIPIVTWFKVLKPIITASTFAFSGGTKAIMGFNTQLKVGSAKLEVWSRAMKMSIAASSGFGKVLKTIILRTRQFGAAFSAFGKLPQFALLTAALWAIEKIILKITGGIGNLDRAVRNLHKDLENLSSTEVGNYKTESDGYKDLVNRLSDANEGSEERRQIISKLNSQYGQYLDFIVDETTKTEDLANAYETVTKRMKESAKSKVLEQGYEKIQKTYYDLREEAKKELSGVGVAGSQFLGALGFTTKIQKKEIDDLAGYIESKLGDLSEQEIENLDKEMFARKSIAEFMGIEDETRVMDANKAVSLIDVYIKQQHEILDLEKQINGQLESSNRTRAQINAYRKLENDYAKELKDIESGNYSENEVKYLKEKAALRYEENKIQLRVELGEISDTEAEELRKNLQNKLINIAQEVNNRLKVYVARQFNFAKDFDDYIEENIGKNLPEIDAAIQLYNRLRTNESDIAQGISKYEQAISGDIERQLQAIREILKQKQLGYAVDEEDLNKQILLLENLEKQASLWGIKPKELSSNWINAQTYADIQSKFSEKYHGPTSVTFRGLTAEDMTYTQVELAEKYNKLADEQKKIVDALNKSKAEGVTIDALALAQATANEEAYRDLAKWLGYVKSITSGTGGQKESVSAMISLIKEMRAEYDKLSKSAYGFAKSNEKVRESFSDAFAEIFGFAGIDINQVDTTSKSATVKAMELVKKTLDDKNMWGRFGKDGGKKARAEFEKALAGMRAEVDIELTTRKRENVAKQLEDAFSDFQLTLDLEKLQLPSGLLKDMFDIDGTDLAAMRQKLEDLSKDLTDENGVMTGDNLKLYEQWLKKLDDEERKLQQQRLKDYSKYLEYQLSDRAKLEMEYVRKVAEVQSEIAYDDTTRQRILDGLRKEYEKNIAKQDWEDFKGSEMYIEMMEDLTKQGTAALEEMRKKLLEVRDNAENLSPRALKEVINALEKIDETIYGRMTPFQAVRELRKQARGAMNENGVMDISEAFERDRAAKEEYEKRRKLHEAIEENIADRQKEADLEEQIGEKGSRNIDELREYLEIAREQKKAAEEYRDLLGEENKDNQEEYQRTLHEIENWSIQIEQYQKRINLLTKLQSIQDKIAKSEYSDISLEDLTKMSKEELEAMGISEDEMKNIGEILKYWKLMRQAEIKALEEVKNYLSIIQSIGKNTADMLHTLGVEQNPLSDYWEQATDAAFSYAQETIEAIKQFKEAKIQAEAISGAGEDLMTGNYIKLALRLLGVLLQVVNQIGLFRGARIDKSIEDQQKRIDALTMAYARLEKQIERTWDSVSYMSTYNQQVKNIREQIAATEAQLAAARQEKGADTKEGREKIRGYENALVDLYDQLEDNEQKMREVFGGIGEEGYRSAAQGFVEAWKSAFLETGDGLQGLQDHFDEFLQEWFVKQATMLIARKYLDNMFDQIDAAVHKNGNGGVEVMWDEIQGIMDTATEQFPAFSAELEEFFRRFGGFGEGSLSGLAAGIQGMTEEQANILEAYWNSVRMYTASIDMNVSRIAEMLGVGGANTNPMLQQMSLIAANTQATHQLLQSVTKSGHSLGGYGIKVFND